MSMNKKTIIICEETYAETIWAKQFVSGLAKELKKSRHGYELVFHGDKIEKQKNVCVIAFNAQWTEAVIGQCNLAGCIPVVLSNQTGRIFPGSYHLICPDAQVAVKNLKNMKLKAYGAMAVKILNLVNQGDVTEITVKMKCEASDLIETAGAEAVQDTSRILTLGRVEQLMENATDMDHHIIAMLLNKATYAEIAERSYMSEGNVKYRVKKYMTICGCSTKRELLELLREYLQ